MQCQHKFIIAIYFNYIKTFSPLNYASTTTLGFIFFLDVCFKLDYVIYKVLKQFAQNKIESHALLLVTPTYCCIF